MMKIGYPVAWERLADKCERFSICGGLRDSNRQTGRSGSFVTRGGAHAGCV
jgi:hypothetical protein